MALFINNQVIDFNESPGIVFNPSGSSINANSYSVGTILFDQATQSIFRNQGTIGSQSWVNYPVPGGGGENLQQTLAIGNVSNDIGMTLFNTSNGQIVEINTDTIFIYKDNIGNKYTKIDYESYAIRNDDLGNVYRVDGFTTTQLSTGISQSINSDINTTIIETFFDVNAVGLKLDYGFSSYSLGDYNVTNNGTSLLLDDNNQETTLTTNKIILNGSLIALSAGSTSGAHLKVTISGVDYVIELRNP